MIPPQLELTKHQILVRIAEKWLYSTMGCGAVFTEITSSAGETPDAFGLRGDYTILVECKTSRADFLADKKKHFRLHPQLGIGDYRFFLCYEDIINVKDLPEKWGLLYWDGKKVKKIKAPKGNISSFWQEFKQDKSVSNEYRIMYSALRRLQEKGLLKEIYNNNKSI